MPMWMIVSLLGLVILLYASLLPRAQERRAAPEDFLDSMGDTLQQFADEIEQENKELLRMVGDLKREHERRTASLLSRIEQLERQAVPSETRSVEPNAAVPAEGNNPEPRKAEAAASPLAAVVPQAEPAAPVTQRGDEPAETEADAAPAAARSSRFAGTVKARYKELFELYDAGKSIEYIAKKLGKNKGEVQLIIGLAKQEEPQHDQP